MYHQANKNKINTYELLQDICSDRPDLVADHSNQKKKSCSNQQRCRQWTISFIRSKTEQEIEKEIRKKETRNFKILCSQWKSRSSMNLTTSTIKGFTVASGSYTHHLTEQESDPDEQETKQKKRKRRKDEKATCKLRILCSRRKSVSSMSSTRTTIYRIHHGFQLQYASSH